MTVDDLIDRASIILAGTALPMADPDDETLMDFLSEHGEFMTLIEESATAIVGRPSHGAGDREFEAAMVALMDTIQSRLPGRSTLVLTAQQPGTATT